MAIKKIGKGNYFVDVSLGSNGSNGKRVRVRRKNIATLKEAKQIELEILELNNRGVDVTTNSLTKDIIQNYLEESKKFDKPSTYTKKYNVFDNHINHMFSNFKIRDITKYDIAKFKEYLVSINMSNNYRRYIFTTLKTFFNYCMKHEIIYKNPTVTIDNFKKEKIEMKFWSVNEFKKFISQVDDKTYFTLFYLLYFTGIRRGEALALTWEDIDFFSAKLHITKTCSHVHKKGYVITKPKTNESNRIIQLNEKLVQVLREYKDIYYEDNERNMLFVKSNKVIPKTTIDRNFKKYIDLSDVKKIRIHDFRHSHVALLIHLKQDVLSISKRLGHSDVSITLGNYGHLYDDADKKVANILDTLTI